MEGGHRGVSHESDTFLQMLKSRMSPQLTNYIIYCTVLVGMQTLSFRHHGSH